MSIWLKIQRVVAHELEAFRCRSSIPATRSCMQTSATHVVGRVDLESCAEAEHLLHAVQVTVQCTHVNGKHSHATAPVLNSNSTSYELEKNPIKGSAPRQTGSVLEQGSDEQLMTVSRSDVQRCVAFLVGTVHQTSCNYANNDVTNASLNSHNSVAR